MTGKRQPIDKVFLALVLAELFFGIIMLKSASGQLSFERFQNSWGYAWHQIYAGVIPGLVGMFVFSRIDYRRWERLAPLGMIIALALMVLVFVPGVAADFGTARSWIMVGPFFSFQPVEALKLAMVVYFAALFASPGRTPRQAFLPAGLSFGIGALLLLAQPDLGSLLILVAIFVIMVFSAGVPIAYLAGIMAVGGAALYAFARSASYRAARLMVFLHPELDPQGIGYQINQAFLAIGSGGLFGLGLGNSRQKYEYLPQVMDDSIFPVIAEELGFFFCLGFIALVAAIFFRGMRIARNARDKFGRLIVLGVMGWVAAQTFLNIGAMLGLVPLTGVPLPLISYGGTAMAITLCALGLVLSVSRGTTDNS